MPIPRTRKQLVDLVTSEYGKLATELEDIDQEIVDSICVDDWTVKDLLAVRLWWTKHVLDWVTKGLAGKVPVTPARGYRWHETPRLNNDIVHKARDRSYRSIRQQLGTEYRRLLRLIDKLDDRQLLETGVFEWAGNYPVSRWLSINTARQYHTARTYLRKAKRNQVGPGP